MLYSVCHASLFSGTCICEPNYGYADCSIDLRIPPFFDYLLDEGHCDVEEYSCDEAFAFGTDFVEEGEPTCMIQPFFVISF